VRLFNELGTRNRDLLEALEYQTATSDVLKVISRSTFDLQPVLGTLSETAARLCAAELAFMTRHDGHAYRFVTAVGSTPETAADAIRLKETVLDRHSFVAGRGSITGRVISEAQVVQIPDLASDPEYTLNELITIGGIRTLLGVPLLREGAVIGTMSLGRQRVEPFTQRQIELVRTFADQAVIAIENERLLGELRERTNDLQEALEYQTATTNVLKVISRSTFDLQPVLHTLAETALRLCEAEQAYILRREGEVYRAAAAVGASPDSAAAATEYQTYLEAHPISPGRGTLTGRVVLEGRAVHIADVASDPEYMLSQAITLGNIHTQLGVPLLREGSPIGVIILSRQRVQPFTERQIELVRTFADQAVIAMENTRLITETREALDQQTATAEVLGVINASPGDLTPVFDAMLEKAHTLCGVEFGSLQILDGDEVRAVAARGLPEPFVERLQQGFRPEANHPIHRLLGGDRIIQLDMAELDNAIGRAAFKLGGMRTVLFVPLRQDDVLLGYITAGRPLVRAFSEKEIALLENFAAQAVIAMENARLITETREALEQQTATSEVLGVINSSPGDLAPVFDAMLDKALHLCEASFGNLVTYDGECFHFGSARGDMNFNEWARLAGPLKPGTGTTMARLVHGERIVHIDDIADDEAYRLGDPTRRAFVEIGGFRTLLGVALEREGALLGALHVYRREVRPFSEKQIALLQNFAAQAVIAMENARLITETREALEQQTATAEVLGVINSSPGDLAPVFDVMLEKAMRLCGAAFGLLFTYDGEQINAAALHNIPQGFAEFLRRGPVTPAPNTALASAVREREPTQIPDVLASGPYREGDPFAVAAVETGGVRTVLSVPLVRDDAVLGVIAVFRQEVRPFAYKQIALLRNFAAQAVIAMENARLINETREALEQQTATAEVLQVINASPGNLSPVFDAMLQKAMHLCDAAFGILWMFDQDRLFPTATRGVPQDFASHPFDKPPGPGTAAYRFLSGERSVVQNLDLAAEEAGAGDPLRRSLVDLAGARSALHAPLCRDNEVLGIITIYRQEVRPFTDKQIALLQNFAAQAVIAIENARLLNEIRQRQAELRVTFDNMADGVAMFDEDLRLAAWNRNFQQIADLPEALLVERPSYPDYLRILTERGELDTLSLDEELSSRLEHTEQELRLERTRPNGRVIEVRRNAVPGGGFVLIYSDITERKRSEAEIRAARDAAEAAYRDLKAAQSSLIQAQKMAALGQLTAGIAHEIKNPLNFVNNFAGLSVELLDELKASAEPAIATLDEDTRAEIDDTIEMLTGNLEKIVEHGQRADGIVKSMLEHSRGVTNERRKVDLNNLVEEALNLAYHGARAQDQNFNITLEREYAKDLADIEVVPQQVNRVFINLIGNGFYAATKRQRESGEASYRPILKVETRDLGEAVEIRIRDNGIGIPPDMKDKLFQPFFTTKPTGEGTGLGLSISYDIVTQQHGGTIEVESEVGGFTEFTVRIPRSYRATAEAAS
jgi:GAF domain-containing protein